VQLKTHGRWKILKKLKRTFLCAAALLLVIALTVSPVPSAVHYEMFGDVHEEDWFFEPVNVLASQEIIRGFPDGSFRPGAELRCGELLTMLAEAFFSNSINEYDSGPHWASKYCLAAQRAGVLVTGENTAEWLQSYISRYDTALFLNAVSEKVLREDSFAVSGQDLGLSDAASIPAKYKNAVEQCCAKGLVIGYTDGSFGGSRTLTRSEAAQMILRLLYPQARIVTDFNTAAGSDGPVIITDDWFIGACFIGDSLTDGLRRYSGLSQATYLCRSGAGMSNILTHLSEDGSGVIGDSIKANEYAAIFIMLGINEIWRDTESFRAKYEEMLDVVCFYQPDADIYIQSILPVTAAKDAEGSDFNNARIRAANELLKNICAERGLRYVDLHSRFVDSSGVLPADKSWDGLHLELSAYPEWISYIQDYAAG